MKPIIDLNQIDKRYREVLDKSGIELFGHRREPPTRQEIVNDLAPLILEVAPMMAQLTEMVAHLINRINAQRSMIQVSIQCIGACLSAEQFEEQEKKRLSEQWKKEEEDTDESWKKGEDVSED